MWRMELPSPHRKKAAALPAMGALLALLFALALVPAQPRTALRLGLLLLVIGGWTGLSKKEKM